MVSASTRLLVDDEGIASLDGLTRRLHPCRKLDRPVLEAETPRETEGGDSRLYLYGTVLRDPESGRLRMWYSHASNRLMLAESEDGLRWTRSPAEPELRLHSPSLVFDPDDPNPQSRFKLLGCRTSGGAKGYCTARSPDGVAWTLYPVNPVLPGSDTCTLAHDREAGEFLAFHKLTLVHRGHRRRLVFVAASRDMQAWSKPELALAPDEADDAQAVAEGGICAQFYNMSAFRRGGQWLGLATHFRLHRRLDESLRTPTRSLDDGPIDVQLVHSRDGRTWRRFAERRPVIPNGPGAFDAGCILGVANGPVDAGDEMWVYYTAITTPHGGAIPEKKVAIARAAWRRDGWLSLEAGPDGGGFDTTPMPAGGARLTVNASLARGSLRAAVLDGAGHAVPGYELERCVPVDGDGVALPVRWKDRDRLPDAEAIRLRFRYAAGHLFGYTLAPG